jgi:hypothetical protein
MRKSALVAILISALLIPVSAQGATAKAGAKCTKLKSTQVVAGKKYTCIKSGKKLVWDKGVKVVVKPTPKPTPTPTPVVVKKSQEIKFSVPPFVYFTAETSSPDAAELVTTAGLKVTYSASGACSFNSATNSLSLTSIGTCSLTGSQAGDADYLPALSVTKTFEVKKMPQTIEVDEFEDQDLLTVKVLPITFTSDAAAPEVVITSNTEDICTTEDTDVTFLAEGDCELTFTKAGNEYYEAAPAVTRTIKVISSAQPGDAAMPAELGVEVTKKDVIVIVDGIGEEVSDAVCEADSANEACIDEDGIGVFDAESDSRYVEIALTITNNSEETWIATRIGLQVDADNNYEHTMVFGIDSLDELELEPGDSITGSYFVLLPNDVDSAETFIYYGDDTEEGMFYFAAK